MVGALVLTGMVLDLVNKAVVNVRVPLIDFSVNVPTKVFKVLLSENFVSM